MKRMNLLLVSATLLVFTILFSRIGMAQTETSCECATLSCGPCETETDTTFYSAKCGPNNSRVKSCKKPTCEPVENQKICLAKQQTGVDEQASANRKHKKNKDVTDASGVAVGKIIKFNGAVRLLRAEGRVDQVAKDVSVFQGDTVETKADGSVHL